MKTYVEREECDIYCFHSFLLTTVDGREMLVEKVELTCPKEMRPIFGVAVALY